MSTAAHSSVLPLGVMVCGNCRMDEVGAFWPKIRGEIPAKKGGLHFHHYRLDVEAGNWRCPRCHAVNTVEHGRLSEDIGAYRIEALIFGANTEHGEYFYPEWLIREHGHVVQHEELAGYSQFEFYDAAPAIKAALKAARAALEQKGHL
jgi:hypothetical protein